MVKKKILEILLVLCMMPLHSMERNNYNTKQLASPPWPNENPFYQLHTGDEDDENDNVVTKTMAHLKKNKKIYIPTALSLITISIAEIIQKKRKQRGPLKLLANTLKKINNSDASLGTTLITIVLAVDSIKNKKDSMIGTIITKIMNLTKKNESSENTEDEQHNENHPLINNLSPEQLQNKIKSRLNSGTSGW